MTRKLEHISRQAQLLDRQRSVGQNSGAHSPPKVAFALERTQVRATTATMTLRQQVSRTLDESIAEGKGREPQKSVREL
jgi:hypothetical protein